MVLGLTSMAWPSIHWSRYAPTVIELRSMYWPCLARTPASSRAAFAVSSVANPPTHLGLLMPVSESLTRITYDQVFPRFMTPSRSLGVVLRGFPGGGGRQRT